MTVRDNEKDSSETKTYIRGRGGISEVLEDQQEMAYKYFYHHLLILHNSRKVWHIDGNLE